MERFDPCEMYFVSGGFLNKLGELMTKLYGMKRIDSNEMRDAANMLSVHLQETEENGFFEQEAE